MGRGAHSRCPLSSEKSDEAPLSWQHTLQEIVAVPAPPARVFAWIDDPTNTGLHMSRPSMAMLGGSLRVQRLSQHATGVGATYRSWGRVLGLPIDFTTTVTSWLPEQEKVVETRGTARLIVIRDFQMRSSIARVDGSTRVAFGLAYNLPEGRVGRLLGWALARPYVRWCLRRIAQDAGAALGATAA
jgi:hypothetical protein